MAGKRVLVVDDDVKTVELVKLYLKRDGYQVLTAYDGVEALHLARESSPDLIVLDLMLPDIDGLEICRILRHESDVPIIMLTARTTDQDKLIGLGLGADDYVTKPFSPKVIAARVRAVLRRLPGERGPEQIKRDELSINFVFYNPKYDLYEGLPDWSKNSLKEHMADKRKYIYNLEDFENAETHNEYWNAAQIQMVNTGKMHGYMRMYWGKKIIEWTKSPKEAYKIALFLNNKYELDGRDPNGFTGVAWCFGKHDRPWKERPIFGKIRYMNANGLKRKFDIDLYAKKFN